MKGFFILLLMIRGTTAHPVAMVETQRPWLADLVDQQDKDAGSNEVGVVSGEGNWNREYSLVIENYNAD